MNGQTRRRAGQPILAFLTLLLGWIGIRMAVWESPLQQNAPFDPAIAASLDFPGSDGLITTAAISPAASGGPGTGPNDVNGLIAPRKPGSPDLPPRVILRAAAGPPEQDELTASQPLLVPAMRGQEPVPAVAAQSMGAGQSKAKAETPSSVQKTAGIGTRWSMDGWLFLRPDAAVAANTGARFASYGASQAGAVLRYRLKPGSAARPAAYVRATRALAAGRESEVAAGLSASLFRGIPIAAHGELRATRNAFTTELRPAGFVVTEIPPVPLPLGLRGETYLAGGYVGGDFATAFVDGQIRIDGEIARFELGNLRAGAGVWGGAQKGAARLDVGPSASMNVKLGAVPARIAVDYRLRAAGDAEPGSGAAFTLSTGF